MNELHQELDQALRAVPVSEAPVERVKRDGRRLRTRRRTAVVAGALAVIAVAVGLPTLGGSLTANKVTPTDSRPVQITDTPPPGTTHAAGGLASSSGVVAEGKVGDIPWHVRITTDSDKSVITYFCLTTAGSVTVDQNSGKCSGITDLGRNLGGLSAGLDDSEPATSTGGAAIGSTYYQLLAVAKDVPYLFVSFTDGQQLKLTPVTVGGHRFAAWVAPLSMTAASVTAHLGGPYTDNGQTVIATPFSRPGVAPVVGLWQKPGQAGPPRAQGVIGAGPGDGQHWSAAAEEGPWGTCVLVNGASSDCAQTSRFTDTGLMGWQPAPGVAFGSAAPGVARVKVTMSDGKSVQVKTAQVGNERLFACWLEKGERPVHWTSYNAAGQQVGSGKV